MIPFSHNIAIAAIMPVMGYKTEVTNLDSLSVRGSACVYTKCLDSVAAEKLLRNGSFRSSVGKSSFNVACLINHLS